jgi:hypothetical protein
MVDIKFFFIEKLYKRRDLNKNNILMKNNVDLRGKRRFLF